MFHAKCEMIVALFDVQVLNIALIPGVNNSFTSVEWRKFMSGF